MYPDGPLRVADFFSRSAFEAFRSQSDGRIEVAGHFWADDVSVSYEGSTAVARLRPISGNFFSMLRLQPATGRLLMPADESASSPLTVTVSHAFWEKNLHGDVRAIGRALRINNRAYTITGVLPESFGGIAPGDSTDLYTTIDHSPPMLDPENFVKKEGADPRTWYIQLLGRIKPGSLRESVAAEMNAIFRATWAAEPKDLATAPTIRLQDASGGLGGLRREFGSPLVLLFALVACVLAVACANIANLMSPGWMRA